MARDLMSINLYFVTTLLGSSHLGDNQNKLPCFIINYLITIIQ